MSVCESFLPDVMASGAHQNDLSYVHEFCRPTCGYLHKNLTWWVVTWRTSKNHKTVKIEGWVLAQDNKIFFVIINFQVDDRI